MTTKPTPTEVPARLLPRRTPTELLVLARRGLDDAAQTRPDGLRYAAAHLAALRAGAAVLATRAVPIPAKSSRTPGVWVLLIQVAPELGEWADYFAVTARKSAAAEAGVPGVVTAKEADERLRSARELVALAESIVGEAGVL